MKNIKTNFHYDAGHGWLKVTTRQLSKLGIYDQVSHYSYIDVANTNRDESHDVYLEEDCDAPLFLEACKSKGIKVHTDYIDDGINSPIRRKHRFPSRKAQTV